MIPLEHQNNNYICGNLLAQCSIYIDWFGNMWYPFDDTQPIIKLDEGKMLQGLTPVCYRLKNKIENYVFCRIECLRYLFDVLNYHHIDKCVLFTTSDHLVDQRFIQIIEDDRIDHWYGHNIAIKHPKVTPIPLGIRIFSDEELELYKQIFPISCNKKHKLYNANFNIESNPKERNKCKEKCYHTYISTPIQYSDPKSIISNRKQWHDQLASAYFELAPRGFSIPMSNQGDNHRIWEALYHSTIPVTTPSPLTDMYAKIFPIMVIDDWNNFNVNMLTPELYHKMWSDRPDAESYLQFDYFFSELMGGYIKDYNIYF